MADDVVIWNTLSALAGSVIGAVAARLTKREERAPDMQASLTAAVDVVVKHYREALDRSDTEAAALRADIAELRGLVEGQSTRIEEQSAEIVGLVTHIAQLEAAIVDLGGKPPARGRRQQR